MRVKLGTRIKKITIATRIMVVGLLTTLTLGTVVQAKVQQSGNDVYFEKHFIDDNTYTQVASGYLNSEKKKLHVKVTKMRDEDGNEEKKWNYTWWKVNKNKKTYCTEVKVTKGSDDEYIILNQKTKPSEKLVVKAHGNKKDLDAKIDGLVYSFKKS